MMSLVVSCFVLSFFCLHEMSWMRFGTELSPEGFSYLLLMLLLVCPVAVLYFTFSQPFFLLSILVD